MAISRPRKREKKLRREGTEKKREQKKDWTKKKIKEITEVVQTMVNPLVTTKAQIYKNP